MHATAASKAGGKDAAFGNVLRHAQQVATTLSATAVDSPVCSARVCRLLSLICSLYRGDCNGNSGWLPLLPPVGERGANGILADSDASFRLRSCYPTSFVCLSLQGARVVDSG
jgi:hypothetical protein